MPHEIPESPLPPPAAATPRSTPTLAELVDRLFRLRRHPLEDREWTYREVALGMPGELSHTTIYSLRSGQNTNPRRSTLLGLCHFFQVPPSYFFPELADKEFPPLPDE